MSLTRNSMFGGWRVMEHPDHRRGQVTTRQMTDEEIKKYGPKSEEKRKAGLYSWKRNKEEKDMGKSTLPFTRDQLLEDCRQHGTNSSACRVIAGKYGIKENAVKDAVRNKKIKEELAKELTNDINNAKQLFDRCKKANDNTSTGCKVDGNTSIDCKSDSNPIVFVDTEETLKYAQKLVEDEINSMSVINMEVPARPERLKLKPKSLLSQVIPGLEYRLMDQCLKILRDGVPVIEIEWDNLEDFILDLQESKEIAG